MSEPDDHVAAVEAGMRAVYDRQANFWHRNRSRDLRERALLELFLQGLPEKADLLDLGCGTGVPIAQHLIAHGYRVTGIDFSAEMIAIAKSCASAGNWHVADMRDFREHRVYHGIYSWDAFFHLTQNEQRRLLPRLALGICADGALMVTIGPGAGEALGEVGDDPVYHSCLSHEEYHEILECCGFQNIRIIDRSTELVNRTVLLARGLRGD